MCKKHIIMKPILSLIVRGSFLLFILLFQVSCNRHKDKPTLAPPVKVTVLEVSGSDQSQGKEFSGTVASSETTTVSFSVAGTITELPVKEGQKVVKGQLLGKVRNGEYLNAYNIAQAQLAEAQDGYNRLKKLHDANALPDVKWVEMEQKLKQAQNAAEMAQRTLNDASLHSPVSGTVTRKFADVGQAVLPVQPIYEIISTTDITIDIPVSENEIGSFSNGDKAVVGIPGASISGLPGKVSQKSLVADPLARSYTVKVAIPNTDGKILPGMIGSVMFENKNVADSSASHITLPSQAVLLNDDNRWFVWVINDSVAERRFVTADALAPNGIIIKSGLAPGDKVIIEGMQKVGTGSKVNPQYMSGL